MQQTKIYFVCVIILCIFVFLFFRSLYVVESFIPPPPPMSVSDQPVDPWIPKPDGMLPLSTNELRNNIVAVENNLMTGQTYADATSPTNFDILRNEPKWRIPQHQPVLPTASNGSKDLSTYQPTLNRPWQWEAPYFTEFPKTTIERWIRQLNDGITWDVRATLWDWKPIPEQRETLSKMRYKNWTERDWREQIYQDGQINIESKPPIWFVPLWEKWAHHWLFRWNALFRNEMSNVPLNQRKRNVEDMYIWGRLYYVQGWEVRRENEEPLATLQWVGEVVRPHGLLSYTVDIIAQGNPDKLDESPKYSTFWMGTNPTDKMWAPDGYTSEKIGSLGYQSTSDADRPPPPMEWGNSFKEVARQRAIWDKQQNSYKADVCRIPNRNPETGEIYNTLLFASSKEDCEDRLDFLGQPKRAGVWDSPCETDNDCLFYQLNKNYPNEYGRCLESKRCQVPVGMQSLGYRYWIPSDERPAMCYNCDENTTEWKPFTDMAPCCEKQKDRARYPHLKGPDYAFHGDIPIREMYYRKTRCFTKNKNGTLVEECPDNGKGRIFVPQPVAVVQGETTGIPKAVNGYDPFGELHYTKSQGQSDATFLNADSDKTKMSWNPNIR